MTIINLFLMKTNHYRNKYKYQKNKIIKIVCRIYQMKNYNFNQMMQNKKIKNSSNS